MFEAGSSGRGGVEGRGFWLVASTILVYSLQLHLDNNKEPIFPL